MKRLLVLCVPWMLSAALLLAQKAPPVSPPASFANASYGSHERHVLDLWQAKSDKPTPLLIYIHGGGWAGGEKTALPAALLDTMLQSGISVASINYRYTSIARIPGPLHDAARAVQFLRGKAAEWKLDPLRIGAYGVSAGATSSLWLAYHDDLADPRSTDPIARQSSRLSVVAGLSPQTCLEPAIATEWIGDQVHAHPMIGRAIGWKKGEDLKNPAPEWVKQLRECSPITHVSAGDPPVLISNPKFDPLPAATPGSAIHHAIFGQKLKEKADAAGVTCVLRLEDKADATTPTPEEFLKKHLLAK
jgi:acetyl esterase/lipase